MTPAARVPLRSYRFAPRKAWLAVDGADVVVRVPGWWGGKTWRAPLAGSAVADLDLVDAAGGIVAGYFEEPVFTPYVHSTNQLTDPNVGLVFATPVPVPNLRLLVRDGLGDEIPKRPATGERPAGRYVDGIMVRAVDPRAAVEALVAAGAERTADPDGWLRARRAAVNEPEVVAQIERRHRAVDRVTNVCLVLMGVGVVAMVAGEPVLGDAAEPGGFALAIASGLASGLARWWSLRRALPGVGSRSWGMETDGGDEEATWRP